MTNQDDLFDVKVYYFSKVGDYSNEAVGLTDIEIDVDVDGEAEGEGEVEGESDSDSSSDTKDVGSYDSEEDAEVVCIKCKKTFYKPSDPVPSLALGLIFTSTRQFKDALVNHDVAKSDGFVKVKKLINQHDCSITLKNSKANYKFIGKYFLGKLRIIPKLTLQEMKRLAKVELHVDVPINLCSKAMMWAKDEINKRFKYEFDRLFDYATALRQLDPNYNVDLMVVRPTPNHHNIFRRFYICFGATKKALENIVGQL
ncbi:hypothetical protein V6N13_130266 [Hibiscus sabdariffa]